MMILGIDTSTRSGGVALVNEKGLISEYVLNLDVTYSERLIPAIDTIIKDSRLSLSEIDGFAVAIGPGSFTGLRIGISTTKALAMASGRPIAGIPTLDAYAYSMPFCKYLLCPILDARKKEIYCAVYSNQNGILERLTEYLVIPVQHLVEKIDQPTIFFGDGVNYFKEEIIENLKNLANFISPILGISSPRSVAEIGLRMIKNGKFNSIDDIIPLYLRRSEAELKWIDKEKKARN